MAHATFESALNEHLSALCARDIERFVSTIGSEVAVVDGSGKIERRRQTILASHAEWFASPEPWSFAYRLEIARDFGSAAFALIDVTYTPGTSKPARFWLVLIFERTADGSWKFVYDQNTPIAASSD